MLTRTNLNDLDSNSLAEAYLDLKDDLELLSADIDTAKSILLVRVDEGGERVGKHAVLKTADYTITKERRDTVSVITDEAVNLLVSKGMDSCIKITSVISVRKGIDPSIIPGTLLDEMRKYFDIDLIKSVDKDLFKKLHETQSITEEEYLNSTKTATSFVLKVAGKKP